MWYKEHRDPNYPTKNNGELDFECIEALRLNDFNNDLNNILDGKTVKIPNFDMASGKIVGYDSEITLQKEGIIIIEGIFCFHPLLTQQVKQRINIFFGYVCNLQFISICTKKIV